MVLSHVIYIYDQRFERGPNCNAGDFSRILWKLKCAKISSCKVLTLLREVFIWEPKGSKCEAAYTKLFGEKNFLIYCLAKTN